MHRIRAPFAAALLSGLVIASCGSDDTESTSTTAASPVATEAIADSTEAMTDSTEVMTESTDVMTDSTEAMTDSTEVMTESTDVMVELADWQKLTLVDVDGVSFTLGDFVGQPVFVENFATWCPTCRTQLGKTNEAAGTLGDQAVVLALSTETDLSSNDVASYAEDNGFTNIRFAVMTPEFLAAMADTFGNSAVNPPSTPHFIIDAMGLAGELATGTVEPDDIVASVQSMAG